MQCIFVSFSAPTKIHYITLRHIPCPTTRGVSNINTFFLVFISMLTKGFLRLHSKRFLILKCEPINILYSFPYILKISTYKKVKVHCTNIYATTTMVHYEKISV